MESILTYFGFHSFFYDPHFPSLPSALSSLLSFPPFPPLPPSPSLSQFLEVGILKSIFTEIDIKTSQGKI